MSPEHISALAKSDIVTFTFFYQFMKSNLIFIYIRTTLFIHLLKTLTNNLYISDTLGLAILIQVCHLKHTHHSWNYDRERKNIFTTKTQKVVRHFFFHSHHQHNLRHFTIYSGLPTHLHGEDKTFSITSTFALTPYNFYTGCRWVWWPVCTCIGRQIYT